MQCLVGSASGFANLKYHINISLDRKQRLGVVLGLRLWEAVATDNNSYHGMNERGTLQVYNMVPLVLPISQNSLPP